MVVPEEHHRGQDMDATVDDLEVEFWERILGESVALAVSTWATMPIIFGLAWCNFAYSCYVLIIVKFCVISVVQWSIVHKVLQYIQEARPQSPELMALLKAGQMPWQAETSAWTMCSILIATKTLVGSILEFTEVVDPDLDFMTPGSVKRAFRKSDDIKFAKSWAAIPVLASVVDYLRLPGVLITGLATVTFYQIYLLRSKIAHVREQIGARHRMHFYEEMVGFAGSGNLMVLCSRFKCLWLSLDCEAATFGGARNAMYRSRVPEMIFQGWFTVSALAFTIDQGVENTIPLLISVTTTLVSSIKLFCEMAFVILPWIRWYHSHSHKPRSLCQLRYVKTLISMVIHAIAFVAICARLIGVWGCSTHDFQLSRMKCA